MLIISRKTWSPCFKKITLLPLQPSDALEMLFCLGWGLCCWIQCLPGCGPSAGRQRDDGLWQGAGEGESGLINTLAYLSYRIIQMNIRWKASFVFSQALISADILQKWHLSSQVKFCFNKNSFHIQFYIVRTFQNLLAHVNCAADVEKIDSDGKTHASLNICMHVCVYVFSIRDVPASSFISSQFIFK